jgi:hypothetical protein
MIKGPVRGSHITIMYSRAWMDDRRANKVLDAFIGRSFAIDHAKRRGNSIYFTSPRLSEFRRALAACGEISLLHEGGRMDVFHMETEADARDIRGLTLTIDVCGHRPWRHKK